MADALAEVEKTGVLKVVGSLSLYMIHLGDEYTKSLQNINPHTQEYIRRLKDESVVVELAGKVQAYYERQGEMNVVADLALLQVRVCSGTDTTGAFRRCVTFSLALRAGPRALQYAYTGSVVIWPVRAKETRQYLGLLF